MLEAQASLTGQPGQINQPGDIIVLALPGHPWGTKDRIVSLIAEWQDDELELVLLTRRQLGEPWPVLVLPYAVWE